MAKDITEWLERFGLARFSDVFAKHDVDLDILPHLSDADLKELGLPLGARRRLQLALGTLAAGDGPTPATEEGDAPAPPEAAQAERRQLTVLFCDVIDSTALSGRLDPEDLRGLLQAFQDTCAGEVEGYGGYLANYMGDGVLAYFGYPEAHEDDAERAINAGLGIVTALRKSRDQDAGAGSPSVRIGIATGFVVVGDLIGRSASQEAAVTGETPNLAARLQQLAEPDTVVIDAATQHLAGGLFMLRSLGMHRLKGFSGPRPAWAVTGRRRGESRFAAVRRERLTRLVGRGEDMELLLRRWNRAKEGEGHLVLITGEPGIGKSRLVHAACERIAAEPHTRLRYQCSPFHANSMLHPVIEHIERAAGFAPDDTPACRLDKLEALIAATGRPVEWDTPLLAVLLSIPLGDRYQQPAFSPQRQKQLLLQTLLGHLTALAERQPVLFFLEDAHWMDPTTQELLDLTVEQVPRIPVLMVVTHRPEFDAPWAGRPHVTLMTLNRLTRRASTALATAVEGGDRLPDTILEQIVARTDGIPLFIEEFTRAAVESDAGSEKMTIPMTLKDALEARLSRLLVGREVVQVAAAIGRTFDHSLIQAVCSQDGGRLDRALGELVGAGLLFARGEPPEASYTFKHALVQDTAYDSLLSSRRSEIHARIAQVLESGFPAVATEQPEVLAHHLTRSGHVERAIPYWQRAGETCARRSALEEAVHHFTRALGLVRAQPESKAARSRELELQLHLAPVYQSASGFGALEAKRAYRRARDIAKELGDPDSLFTAQWGLWLVNTDSPGKGTQKSFARALLELSEARGDPGQRLQAHHASWTTHFLLGDIEAVKSHAEAGWRIYDPQRHAGHRFLFGGHDPGVCGRYFLAFALFLEGRSDSALAALGEALARAEDLGHPLTIILAGITSAMFHLSRREPDPAAAHICRATVLAEEHGVPQGMWGDAIRGWILAERGRPAEGLATMQRTFGERAAVGHEVYRSMYLAVMAALCGRVDRAGEGLELVSKGLDLAHRHERYWCLAELHRVRGGLLRLLGHPAGEVEQCYRQALEISGRQNARAWHLRAATDLARHLASNGDTAAAHELLTPACASFTEGPDTADLADARALLRKLG